MIRICELIAIGFGEAGAQILKENISSNQMLNPMIEGKQIDAIFGFCYIHDFPAINEALQEQTMIFVNEISEIVHSSVDKFNGIVNKNLGDCYLLAWKFNRDSYSKDRNKILNIKDYNDNIPKNNIITYANINHYYSECAVMAYLCILKKIYKSKNIIKYRKDSRLISKFGINFKIEMGMGVY